jgi:hypothetical protein
MTVRPAHAVAVVAVAAGVLLATMGTTDAQTVRAPDVRGDVAQVDIVSDAVTQVPHQVDGDITGSRFSYGREVVAVVHFADLRRTGTNRKDVLQIRTDEGLRRDVDLDAEPGDWAGVTTMTGARGARVTCPGIEHRIDYTTNTVTVRVPVRCLSTPRWVRLGFAAAVLRTSDVAPASITSDDALRDEPLTRADRGSTMSGRIPRAG